MRSAARFQEVMMPLRSLLTIASSDESTTLARWRSSTSPGVRSMVSEGVYRWRDGYLARPQCTLLRHDHSTTDFVSTVDHTAGPRRSGGADHAELAGRSLSGI